VDSLRSGGTWVPSPSHHWSVVYGTSSHAPPPIAGLTVAVQGLFQAQHSNLWDMSRRGQEASMFHTLYWPQQILRVRFRVLRRLGAGGDSNCGLGRFPGKKRLGRAARRRWKPWKRGQAGRLRQGTAKSRGNRALVAGEPRHHLPERRSPTRRRSNNHNAPGRRPALQPAIPGRLQAAFAFRTRKAKFM
jgi:hypothetical protein